MLDARTGRLLRTIPANPRAMQIDAGQARLYITDESGAVNRVHVVDTNTGAIVRTDTFPQFQGTSSVQQLALDTPAQRVIVASYVPGVTILDARTGRILRSRQVPNGTTQLVVDERAGGLSPPATMVWGC